MSKAFYQFFCPVKIIAGFKALEHIPYELTALGACRPLLITDQGVLKAGLIDHVTQAFDSSGIKISNIFDNVPADSSLDLVNAVAQIYLDNSCDAIIAVGGGSVIDTSKGVNILVSEGGEDVTVFAGIDVLNKPLKPFFAIPTTAGTGSEVTSIAVITNTEREIKTIFSSPFLLPDAAILDPRMTLTLPPQITAATAMDALTHAIEAFTCLGKNPMSDAYAVAAIKKISDNLLHVLDEPNNKEGRLALAQASTMAGIAFSNSMVGLVHSIGHAIGALCHIPHGLCMSILLPYVLEFNLDNGSNTLGELLLPLCGKEAYCSTSTDKMAIRTIQSIHDLKEQLHQHCQLPRTLEETEKVRIEQFDKIAEIAIDDGSLILNPVGADKDDVLSILSRAWKKTS